MSSIANFLLTQTEFYCLILVIAKGMNAKAKERFLKLGLVF